MHVTEHQHNFRHYVIVGNYVVYVNSLYVNYVRECGVHNLVYVNLVFVNSLYANLMSVNSL
jgi:hypothetical protein